MPTWLWWGRALAAMPVAGCMVRDVPSIDLADWGLPAIVVPAEQHIDWPSFPSSPSPRVATRGVSGAVIVSLERYAYGEGRPRAHEVAAAWHDWLRHEANVPEHNIAWLRDEQATRTAVERNLIAVGANSERPGAVLVLFIGHGFTDDRHRRELMMLYDSDPSSTTHPGLTQHRFLQIMAAQERVRVLAVWDACQPPHLQLQEHQRGGIAPRSVTSPDPRLSTAASVPVEGTELVHIPSSGKVRPRITVLSAGLGDACVETLPGDGRPALAYWTLAGLHGWADQSADSKVGGGELGRFAMAWSRAIVDERHAARGELPGTTFLAARFLWHTLEASSAPPSIHALLPPEQAAMLTESRWAGGGVVAPPPLPASLGSSVTASHLPPDVAAATCRAAERAARNGEPGLAELEWQCTRWRAYARRWTRFLEILDRDHSALVDMLDGARRPGPKRREQVERRVTDFLRTYTFYAHHPKVRAVALAASVVEASPRLAWLTARNGDMVDVGRGTMFRGCARSDRDCEPDEHPSGRIWLDSFGIDRTEVSNLDYRFCEQAGACARRDLTQCYVPSKDGWKIGAPLSREMRAPDRPAVCVSWTDAQRYCAWRGAELPTEAQWEKAARGPGERIYPWTDEPDRAVECEDARYGECRDEPVAVGDPLRGISPYGALHMAGNVAEWVSDIYGPNHARSLRNHPRGATRGKLRSVRGGSFADPPQFLRASYRFGLTPFYGYAFVGFRCAVKR